MRPNIAEIMPNRPAVRGDRYERVWLGAAQQTFAWVATRFSDVSDVRFDVEAVGVCGGLAYTLGFERWTGSIAGRPIEPVNVRVTHIYRREDGEWKIFHRHGDNPGPDSRQR